jgi:RsiW-degrading membrane proteinase PrsW (M82 family)
MAFPDPFTAALLQAVVLLALVRALDVYEREPVKLLALMAVWGAVGATSIALLGNNAISALLPEDVDAVWGAAISAPLVEEVAKGLALVAAFLASIWTAKRFGNAEFNGPTDGMVYGVAVGVGFAFAENNFYLLQEERLQDGLAVLDLREGFFNLNTLAHGIYTGLFGAGLGMATWTRDKVARVLWPLGGLALGMALHALHNGLVSLVLVREYGFQATADLFLDAPLPDPLIERMIETADATVGAMKVLDYALVPLFLLALGLWVRHQRRVLVHELQEEVATGLVTPAEVRFASHYGLRLTWYARLVMAGRFEQLSAVRRAYAELAELAFAKWRRRVGDGPEAAVESRRVAVRRLRAEEVSVP